MQSSSTLRRLAVVQMAMGDRLEDNVVYAIERLQEAASGGAHIVLLPELFEGLYFPQQEREESFALAYSVANHPFLSKFQAIAAELNLVIPLSFFEKAGQAHYNSLATINTDGQILGIYRKSHIPDGPGYEEKYYFNPGDTGFQAFRTPHGAIGTGICWDQWYPEAARCMALLGADLLLYPTAIGSEPPEAGGIDTQALWQRAMVGHAVSNACYVAAANRIGQEGNATFYGSSFICDYQGEILAAANRTDATILYADLDFSQAQQFRAGMGFFRDRRPDLYKPLLTWDGKTPLGSS